MSQWSAYQSPRTSRAPQQAVARKAEPRQSAAKPPAAAKTSGYTFAHAGRQIRLGPVAFWIAVGTVVILAGWSATTATYFAFSDDVLKGLIARQAEQQYAYEDRIAELRAQIDRTTSRQLLDQEQFEQKLNDLLRRQAALESRATALSGISDPATTGSLRSSSTGGNDPKPVSDSLLTPHLLDRGTALEPDRAPTNKKPGKEADIGTKLGRIEASLDRVDRREGAALAQLQARYEGKARKMRGRPRPTWPETRRQSAARHRRPVRAGGAAVGKPKFRARADPRQHRARLRRQAQRHAGQGAGARAGDRRDRFFFAVWRARRSVPACAGDAHRNRFPRQLLASRSTPPLPEP